jgi:hypothetical protein
MITANYVQFFTIDYCNFDPPPPTPSISLPTIAIDKELANIIQYVSAEEDKASTLHPASYATATLR